jgi:hypothetical protein
VFGSRQHRERVPVDLDLQLLSDQVSRQLSPTALRNQSADGGFVEIAPRSPIAAYRDNPSQVTLGIREPRPDSRERLPAGFAAPGVATDAIAVRVGR